MLSIYLLSKRLRIPLPTQKVANQIQISIVQHDSLVLVNSYQRYEMHL